ncbi:hypothetical protein AS200_02175 [Streptomyces sp. CdTB01]|nr:hypothetical protein AS200_02175 [Streptomyces sp. CdTB01]
MVPSVIESPKPLSVTPVIWVFTRASYTTVLFTPECRLWVMSCVFCPLLPAPVTHSQVAL